MWDQQVVWWGSHVYRLSTVAAGRRRNTAPIARDRVAYDTVGAVADVELAVGGTATAMSSNAFAPASAVMAGSPEALTAHKGAQ